MKSIPILVYHEVHIPEKLSLLSQYIQQRYLIDKSIFEKHIEFLANKGYRVTSLSGFRKLEKNDHSKAIIMTFDDGYEGNYIYCYPFLKKLNFTATFFVTTDWVGKEHMLTWSQIKEMSEGGMEIGSHTCSHALLELEDDGKIIKELENSKLEIEKHIFHPVISISYPNGSYNQRVRNLSFKYRYEFVCSSEFGYWNSVDKVMPRIIPTNDISQFVAIVEKNNYRLFLNSIAYFLKSFLKIMLGRGLYNRIYFRAFNLKKNLVEK